MEILEDRPQILNELKKSGGLLGSLPNSEFAAFTKGVAEKNCTRLF